MYLDRWIKENIFSDLRNSGNGVFFESLNIYHMNKLKNIIAYVKNLSPYYKKKLSNLKIDFEESDNNFFLDKIPLTEQNQISFYPYKFLCVSLSKVERSVICFSSGTTGIKKRIFFTENDIKRIINAFEAGIKSFGEKSDTFLILLPITINHGHSDLLKKAIEKIGARAIISGVDLNYEGQIDLIKKNSVTLIIGSSLYIYRITKEAKESGLDLHKLGIRGILLTSMPSSKVMKKNLRESWGCDDVRETYGLTEMGFGVAIECKENGLHIDIADFYPEVVNPVTGEIIYDDKEGELVLTTLNREGMPLLRYRTKDLTKLINEKCACGSEILKMENVRRRTDDIFKLRSGIKIWSHYFDDIMYSFDNVIDYRISVFDKDGKDKILFEVEQNKNSYSKEKCIFDAIMEEMGIRESTKSKIMDNLEINYFQKGALKTKNIRKTRIIDLRSYKN